MILIYRFHLEEILNYYALNPIFLTFSIFQWSSESERFCYILKIRILFHNKLSKKNIKCGLINILNDGTIERRTIDFKRSKLKKQKELNYVEKQIAKLDTLISSTILLHYDNQFIDKLNIYASGGSCFVSIFITI